MGRGRAPLCSAEVIMYSYFQLLFRDYYTTINSFIVKSILIFFGIDVGRNFKIIGKPYLKVRGLPNNIVIGNNVFVGGDIDIRNRENGKIIIEDSVSIDDNCRFVAANNATLKIGKGSAFGSNCVLNCGENVTIGEKCLFAGMVYLNSSDHIFKKGQFIRDQGYTHEEIVIEDDVWIGGHVSINKGVIIGKGSIIGSNAVVTKNTEPYSINAGVPAKKIGERS